MKNTIKVVGALLFLLMGQLSWGQVKQQSNENLYPEKYTFQQAEKFQREGKINQAMWFYINLYPKHQNKVIKKVKKLKTSIDSVSFEELVKKPFAMYAPIDPEISTIKNGVMTLDRAKLKQKGRWADQILLKISGKDQDD